MQVMVTRLSQITAECPVVVAKQRVIIKNKGQVGVIDRIGGLYGVRVQNNPRLPR
ncbi:hypothetical protein AA19596_2280 [Acetobacter fabarum DSM 19596]|nr:hypothetical protein AA19596_2280 [Acetobacter fabarum DSM 19596]